MKTNKFYRAVPVLVLIFTLVVWLGPALAQEATPEPIDASQLSPDIPAPTEPVTISFASWVGGSPAWQMMAEQFHQIYPTITIEFQDVPFEEIRTKLLTQVAANNPPDTAYLDTSTVGEFASRNALVNLDPYLEKSLMVDLSDYIPAFLQAAQIEGSTYGLPIDAETTGLFYRTDLFEEAGIEGPPTTWEEFRAAAEKLTIPEKKQYGFILFAPEAAYYWYPWLWQAGGDTLGPDGTDVIWDSEEGKRAAEFYVGLRDFTPPDFWNSNSWDGRVAFAEGTVGMYVAGAWFAGVLQNEFPDIQGKWAMAPLPKDQRCATTIAGDALVIFKGSKNPDAAWKWIEFVSAPQNMALLNLGTPDAPATLLPPRRSLLEDPETFKNNPVIEGFAANMDCAVVSPVVQPRYPEMEQLLNEALGRAIYGEVDAATAITEAAQEAEDLLKQ
ncbi:MAG: sugar ABC transporter substrate-binding protein [Chloroflexi bacterium]|nr:sugar ABC transporter substrate-binding protein [Chloroflexota bacterium]